MGCGGSFGANVKDLKEKIPFDKELDCRYVNLNIKDEEINGKFTKAFECLKKLQESKDELVDLRENLANETGGVCYAQECTVEGSVNSMMWYLAKLSDGDFLKFKPEFGEEPNYFKIEGCEDETANTMASKVNEFFTKFKAAEEKATAAITEYNEIYEDFNTHGEEYKEKILNDPEILAENKAFVQLNYPINLKRIKAGKDEGFIDDMQLMIDDGKKYMGPAGNEIINNADYVQKTNAFGQYCVKGGIQDKYEMVAAKAKQDGQNVADDFKKAAEDLKSKFNANQAERKKRSENWLNNMKEAAKNY